MGDLTISSGPSFTYRRIPHHSDHQSLDPKFPSNLISVIWIKGICMKAAIYIGNAAALFEQLGITLEICCPYLLAILLRNPSDNDTSGVDVITEV